MIPIIRFLALTPFIFYSVPSLAIYKCEDNGKIIYSDEKCANGQVKPVDTTNSRIPESAAHDAAVRSKQEKETLRHLEDARRKNEMLEEKARQKRIRAHDALHKKCKAMALKAKWSEEDAASATGRSAEKSKRTAIRNREKYEAECGKH